MDSKKKKLIIILSVVGVIVLAAVIAIAVIFTREPEAPPVAKEGVIYQTEPETFWVGFGSGYMTFENIPEPADDGIASTLTAANDDGKSAKIELMSDNTWVLSISYYEGGDYTATASGTYALNEMYNMVLTVTEDVADALAEDSYTLTVNYETHLYSGTIVCNIAAAGGEMTFNFAQEPAEPTGSELYGMVFKVLTLNEGEWQAWLTGTWEMNADKTELTLTATWDESDGNATKLRDAESGVAKTYTAEDGKFYIGVNFPGGTTGEVTFTLDPAADQANEDTNN